MAIFYKGFQPLNIVLRPYLPAWLHIKGGLEISKKVQYVFVAQRAAKLCFVKLYEKLLQVLQAVVLQPIELQRHTAPFWKPPTFLYLETRG